MIKNKANLKFQNNYLSDKFCVAAFHEKFVGALIPKFAVEKSESSTYEGTKSMLDLVHTRQIKIAYALCLNM